MTVSTLPSACPLDCPDACSLDVDVGPVEGHAEPRVLRVRGSHRSALTNGFICGKVARFSRHMYCPERLLRPQVRVGAKGEGRFEPTSWEEALSLIVERLDAVRNEHGAEAILPCSYGGSNGYLSEGGFDRRFFRRLGASRLARTLCAAPSGAAERGLYGKMPGVALTDVGHAELIVLWGCNPHATSVHLVPLIQEAQARGSKLVVVDPRTIPLAGKADLHLAPRPGTDLPLALALVRWLFEHGRADERFLAEHCTGVDALRERAGAWTVERTAQVCGLAEAQIEQLARMYADASPALIRCGWGPERNRNGGSAIAAILALPAVGGKFGLRGGGYTMSNSGAWRLDAERAAGVIGRAGGGVGTDAVDRPGSDAVSVPREINLAQLGAALEGASDPTVQALFIYDNNPLSTCPDQESVRRGLLREDLFTVVFEQVMTDTARYADVLLPATTFLEHDELSRGYGNYALFRSRPVVAPVGEARSNAAVFVELSDRLGLSREGDARTADELARRILRADPEGPRLARELDSELGSPATPSSGLTPIQFVDVFPRTSDDRVHLLPTDLESEAPLGLYRWREDPATKATPLALISPASVDMVSSTFAQLVSRPATLLINSDDAADRGVTSGQIVRIWNELGEVQCILEVTNRVRPGVVSLTKGLWAIHTQNGATSNALVPATLSDLGGGACFNDARVQVEGLD